MYKSLDTLPYKLFFEISGTNNFTLLANSDKEESEFSDDEKAYYTAIWNKLVIRFQEIDPTGEAGKTIKITREVEFFRAKYKLILIYCECLAFDWDDEIAAFIKEFGYILRDDKNYYSDLERITEEAQGLLVKAEKFESMLPKQDIENPDQKTSIDEMLASYSVILGIDFDYNTVPVTKVLGFKNQVSLKIKIQLAQSSKK